MNRKTLFAWAAYDWANSAITTIVFTFVFSVYFAKGVYGDEVIGSSLWAFSQGCAGVVVAVLSPLVGSAIDRYGPRKPALKVFTILCVFLTASLFLIAPEKSYFVPALLITAALTVCYELVQNIYGSTLPLVASPQKIGLVSGLGWGAGYVGSILSLSIALFAFIGLGDAGGLLGITKEHSFHVRGTMLLAAFWYALFAIPFFVFCPDAPKTQQTIMGAMRAGMRDLWATIMRARRYPELIKFLLASALYRDGLVTLFAVGGLYAGGTLGMNFSEIMMFAIAINIASGVGAMALAFFDDRMGSKTMVMLSLAAIILLGAVVISVHDKTLFMVFTCLLGLFIGPVQAASRALLVRLTPPEQIGAFFGLYALSGKSIAFMGPFMFATLTALLHSQRAGMVSILGFWCAGLLMLFFVKDKASQR